MAGEIYIADKPTLDLTKTNTDAIKQDTTFLKSQFPIMPGTNWSMYNSVFYKINATYKSTESISDYTILNLNRKGYLTTFSIGYRGGTGSEDTDVIVTIDNKIILNAKMQYSSSNPVTVRLTGSFSTTTPSSNSFPQPLFFNNSLSIELKKLRNYEIQYSYGGMIQQ